MNLTNLLVNGTPPPTDSLQRVFYLPVGLSPIQIELYNILTKLHKASLLRKLDNSLNIKNDSIDPEYLNDDKLIEILEQNLSNIFDHPYLLVDHYMPKKLLLMESHERLMFASDKFKKLDLLLELLKTESLDLLLVARSVKELDLIEAFIIGRDLLYKRYSGTSLIDDFNPTEDPYKSFTENSKKDNDDYVPRSKKVSKTGTNAKTLRLHLITRQLLNGPQTSSLNLDFVLSFVSSLKDEDIHTIRQHNPNIRLINFIVLNSPTHGKISLTKSDNEKDDLKTIQFDSLLNSIIKRNEDGTKIYIENFGITLEKSLPFFKEPSKNQWPFPQLPAFELSSIDDIRNSISKIDEQALVTSGNKKIKLNEINIPEKISFKDYHNLLTKLTYGRIKEVEEIISQNAKNLIPIKIKSNLKHLQLDNTKLKVGGLFKELKQLKEDVVGVEKKFERLELEFERLESTKREHEYELKELKDFDEGKHEMNNEIERVKITQQLQNFNETKRLKIEELGTTIDSLRKEYQEITSEAVEKSTVSKALISQNEEILKKLNGKGKQLRSLMNEEVKINKSIEKQKLLNEIQFLKNYNNKLNEIVKDKVSVVNVGRNGRLHRSTTPYN
ncbi:hypothetical protein WICMUC_003620 [Wickerhamomyces mucosus]|uniref:HDA1 complex subunit 2 n=1 Tax=Wickerhamomyces mucosus TaxID=1378264 RepID=A0A9P8PLL9_9ASCO|nr:hypothetical protein WICMUC_003620 [Wickerhamomyces mucosus]